MYKLCAFDLDGTLVNTINDISDSLNHCLEQLGFPTHPESAYPRMVGDGMRMICLRALPEEHKDSVDELVGLYKDRYLNHCCDRSEPYGGVCELLSRLSESGVKCAVVSNKPHEQTRRVADRYFSGMDFSLVLGQSDNIPRKPAPDMLLYAAERCGVTAEETIYVGDSDVDVVFAHSAGIKCIGVEWGFRGKEELKRAGADYITGSCDEIFELVSGK
ncbi:MAG: HAD family hydrolase [Oscillospiraceae bacterium]